MAGIMMLIVLCVVMAVASFVAGALPLSLTLSQSQLRFMTSLGVGILVGTSLIVIIPEGIEAAASSATATHSHRVRMVARRSPWTLGFESREITDSISAAVAHTSLHTQTSNDAAPSLDIEVRTTIGQRDEPAPNPDEHEKAGVEIPGLEVGLSLVLGFILMFLIDRLPRHASESLQSRPQPQHFSLDNLAGGGAAGSSVNDSARTSMDEEAQGFLGSLAPTRKHSRSLATTVGLVIHAAADGIAMGASSVSSDQRLGFIIFIAIMVHKAPAAFGLTSVLLKQGLSKRAARAHLIVFSLAAPAGALSTWLLVRLLGGDNMNGDAGTWWTGMLLLFSGGTFLYVAMHAMQEAGSSHNHDGASASNGYTGDGAGTQRKSQGPLVRDTFVTVAGMLLPLLTQFGHHHH